MPLIPSPTNEMFGRSEFLIHGDSLEHPGAASEGCIILPRFTVAYMGVSGSSTCRGIQVWRRRRHLAEFITIFRILRPIVPP